MDVFWTLPPVTRTITAAAVIISALGHGGIIPLMPLVFFRERIMHIPPEIWRIVTPFLITGPRLQILLDPYFLYNYGSSLETESPRFSRPGDFFTYVIFVALVIVATAGFFLRGYIFLQALTLAFAYTFSQDNPTRRVSLFIITFEAKYLPYSMLLLTFIMSGPQETMSQACGLLAAHLFDFLTRIWPTFGGGTNYITTPRIVQKWFGADNPAPRARGYGTAIPARQRETPAQAAATGRNFGFGGAWDGRGPGRRLGGD